MTVTEDDREPHEEDRSGRGNKKKTPAEEKRTGTVEVDDPDLAKWVARQFAEGEHPSSLKVFQTYGRNGQTLGHQIGGHVYAPTKTYDAEAFAKLANEFVGDAQRDCETLRHRQRYVVIAYDTGRGSRQVAYYPFVCEFSGVGIAPAQDEEHEQQEAKKSEAERLALDYVRMQIEAGQWDKDHYGKVFGDVFILQRETIVELRAALANANAEIRLLHEELRRARREADEALSLTYERKLRYDEHKMWVDMKRDGFTLVRGLIPGLVESATDGKIKLPGKRHPDSLVLEIFLKRCEEKGLVPALFGEWKEDDGKVVLVKDGIFSVRQAKIVEGVANGELDPETLRVLIQDGHPDAITPAQQLAAAQLPGLTQDLLVPLGDLLQRVRARAEAQAGTNSAQSAG